MALLVKRAEFLPLFAGASVALASTLVLVGWLRDNVLLKTLAMSHVMMKPNTAFGLLAGAVVLITMYIAPRHSPARVAVVRTTGTLLALLGAMTLAEYWLGVNLGIDQLIIKEIAADPTPGRMAAIAAFEFLLFGAALLAIDIETDGGFVPAEPLLIGVASLALMALIGYAYGGIPNAGPGHGIQIAIPTAISFVLLASGSLALNLNRGWMAPLMSPNAGGVLARKMLPFVFGIPFCISLLRMVEKWVGGYSVATTASISAVMTMVAFSIIVARAARTLNAMDQMREEAEEGRRALTRQNRIAMIEAHETAKAAAVAANQEQLEAKDMILSHVSHELRTPLAAAHQFVSILLDGIGGELHGDQREYLEIVLRNVKQLQAMIGDLLDTTQIRGGKLAINTQAVSVRQVADDLFRIMRSRANEKGVVLDLVDPTQAILWADATRVRQILTNLLDNGLKFTTSGSITVNAGQYKDDDKVVCISVTDTGPDIPPGALERVFDRLYQIDSIREPGRKGLGLGLYICRELARQMGGKLWVESAFGHGCTFYLTLPKFADQQVQPSSEAA